LLRTFKLLPQLAGQRRHLALFCMPELDVDWSHPWIGSDWIGWDECGSVFKN